MEDSCASHTDRERDTLSSRLSRRRMMQHTARVVLGMPLLGGLLAACLRTGSADNPERSVDPARQTSATSTVVDDTAPPTPTVETLPPTEAPRPTATRFDFSIDAYDWDLLRRPLNLPLMAEGGFCPRTEPRWGGVPDFEKFMAGERPIYLSVWGPDGALPLVGGLNFDGSDDGWLMPKKIWVAHPGYQGPVLIRGRHLDGEGDVRFAAYGDGQYVNEQLLFCGSRRCHEELRLSEENAGSSQTTGVRHWGGYVLLREPGCYAFQIDGEDFSQLIVFQFSDGLVDLPYPLPDYNELPRQLSLISAVRVSPERTRLALGSPGDRLSVRLDIEPAQKTPLTLDSENVRQTESAAGPVLWEDHPEHGWPHHGTWDDGRHRHEFSILPTIAGPNSWSHAHFMQLVEALTTASLAASG